MSKPSAPHPSRRPVVLYVSHAHPGLQAGGAETYAGQLYEAMKQDSEFEPVLLARAGPPAFKSAPHLGTPLMAPGDDPNQYLMFTSYADYDFFKATLRDKTMYTDHFRAFLQAYRPEVVHFQHTAFLGLDMLVETRRTLPQAAVVYTLHEYLPICHNDGQMLRTDGSLCDKASPRRCNGCFPEFSPQDFFMRERFIKSHLELVDQFIAPSRFLRDRYIQWGLPKEKIRYEENGRPPAEVIDDGRTGGPRNRLGFFGQFNYYKGPDLLIEAMNLLQDAQETSNHGKRPEPGRAAAVPRLSLHGANLEFQPEAFQTRFKGLLEKTGDAVTLRGRYSPDQLPRLMSEIDWVVVPSRWWENSPLVIQEAFQHRRPVICSDIGGMAEKVTDGVNGLQFRSGDAAGLAAAITKAVETPGLWDKLRRAIPPIHDLSRHSANLTQIYNQLVSGRSKERLEHAH